MTVDKNRVLQDLYYLEEFVGIKEPGAPPPSGSIDQQINEISKVVVGAPVPVKVGSKSLLTFWLKVFKAVVRDEGRILESVCRFCEQKRVFEGLAGVL